MDKIKMAHEWAMRAMIDRRVEFLDADGLTWKAWAYADAMQAEAEKRNKAEAAQKRKEIREMLNALNTFVEREWQHFDDVESLCEVDWSQSPNDAIGWVMMKNYSYWHGEEGYLIEEAPSFGFTGSHIVERPQ